MNIVDFCFCTVFFKTNCVNIAVMYVFRLEAQTLVKEQSSFKISFLYCLATITFIPLYLFVVIINTYYDGSVTVT